MKGKRRLVESCFSPCAEHAGHDRSGKSSHLLKLREEIQLGSKKNDVRGKSILYSVECPEMGFLKFKKANC